MPVYVAVALTAFATAMVTLTLRHVAVLWARPRRAHAHVQTQAPFLVWAAVLQPGETYPRACTHGVEDALGWM